MKVNWPVGLCRKALLVPPLPKSPSYSWTWKKNYDNGSRLMMIEVVVPIKTTKFKNRFKNVDSAFDSTFRFSETF